jgi:hypothetical protein
LPLGGKVGRSVKRAVLFQSDRHERLRPQRRCEDEDENLERVGSLARGKLIFRFVDTLRHDGRGHLGALDGKVRERRLGIRPGYGRRGENPREMKTQERIGSNHFG